MNKCHIVLTQHKAQKKNSNGKRWHRRAFGCLVFCMCDNVAQKPTSDIEQATRHFLAANSENLSEYDLKIAHHRSSLR